MTEIRIIESRMDVTALTAGAAVRAVAAMVAAVGGLIHRAYVVHRDTAILRSMSDADLSDIGIDRGSIEHAVRHGRAQERL